MREMSATQLMEWMAYYQLEPFGEERADLRIAQLDSLIANVNRDAKKHPKPYTVQDFMMNFDNESEDQEGSVRRHKPKQKNWQDLKAIAKMIVSQRKPRTVRKSELDLEVD